MTQNIIGVGDSPNDGKGDTLRTAFQKINANFDELYATDTSTKYHLGDDIQFVDIDPDSGTIVIQSGFDTGMPVYIKGANCSDGGVGGNVVIEAGGPVLPNDGTTGNIELAAQQTTIESNNNMWSFRDDGVLELPLDGDIVDSNGDSVLGGGGTTLPTDASGALVNDGEGVLSWVALNIPQDTGDLTNNEGFITEASELVNGTNTVSLDNGGLDLTFTSGEKIKTLLGGGIELYRSGDNTIGIYNGYARINTFTTGGAKHTWEFDSTGTLSLPDAGIVKAGADTAQVGSSTVIETGSAYGDTAVSIASDPTLATTYPAGSTITFQDGDVRTIGGYDNYPGGTDIFWDTPKTGTLFPITLKTANYAAATTSPEWTFGTDGRTTFPFNMLATDSQLIIQSDGETEIRNLSETNGIDIVTNITNGDTRWSFGIDSTLTLPAPLAQLTNTNQLDSDTAKIYRATNSTDAEAIQSAWDIWYGHEQLFRLYVVEDESGRGSNFPWHGMPSWEAYPLILNWNGVGLPPSSSMAPAAVAAINAYLAYKELVSSIDIVNGNKTISFDNAGVLSLPGKLEFKDTANAKIILKTIDPYGYVVEDSEQDKTWTFNTNGSLTFPDTTVQTTAYTGTAATATSTSTAASVGYIGMPQNSKSANYELVIGDMGKHVYVTATSTVTVPAYTSVNFPIGTTIAVVAGTGATVTIDITTDTMYLAGPGTTGALILEAFGMATLVKVAQSTWFVSGVGLSAKPPAISDISASLTVAYDASYDSGSYGYLIPDPPFNAGFGTLASQTPSGIIGSIFYSPTSNRTTITFKTGTYTGGNGSLVVTTPWRINGQDGNYSVTIGGVTQTMSQGAGGYMGLAITGDLFNLQAQNGQTVAVEITLAS